MYPPPLHPRASTACCHHTTKSLYDAAHLIQGPGIGTAMAYPMRLEAQQSLGVGEGTRWKRRGDMANTMHANWCLLVPLRVNTWEGACFL